MYCLVNSWHMCMVSTKCLNMCHHYISHFFHKYSINSKGICTSKIKSMRYPFDWITSTKNNILTWITDLNLIVSTFLGQSYRPLAEKIKNSQSGGSPALSPLCYTNYCSVVIPDQKCTWITLTALEQSLSSDQWHCYHNLTYWSTHSNAVKLTQR